MYVLRVQYPQHSELIAEQFPTAERAAVYATKRYLLDMDEQHELRRSLFLALERKPFRAIDATSMRLEWVKP